jgi:hypothetical protein
MDTEEKDALLQDSLSQTDTAENDQNSPNSRQSDQNRNLTENDQNADGGLNMVAVSVSLLTEGEGEQELMDMHSLNQVCMHVYLLFVFLSVMCVRVYIHTYIYIHPCTYIHRRQ